MKYKLIDKVNLVEKEIDFSFDYLGEAPIDSVQAFFYVSGNKDRNLKYYNELKQDKSIKI